MLMQSETVMEYYENVKVLLTGCAEDIMFQCGYSVEFKDSLPCNISFLKLDACLFTISLYCSTSVVPL